MALFAAFVVMHALADFPLQGAYLAQQKAHRTATGRSEWIVALTAHGVIQAGGGLADLGLTCFRRRRILCALPDRPRQGRR